MKTGVGMGGESTTYLFLFPREGGAQQKGPVLGEASAHKGHRAEFRDDSLVPGS